MSEVTGPDAVCEHGTALDVHCCNCHSGFLFDPDSCVCTFDEEDPYCHRCDNKGTIIVCVDDMCRGAGECMHGDGEIVCPDCKGECGDW